MKIFPQKFTLTIAENEHGWFVTTDAHKGYLHFIPPEEGLPEGLRQVPAGLRQILVAQIDADNAKIKETPIYNTYSEREIDVIKERIERILRDIKDGNGGTIPETIKEFLIEKCLKERKNVAQ